MPTYLHNLEDRFLLVRRLGNLVRRHIERFWYVNVQCVYSVCTVRQERAVAD